MTTQFFVKTEHSGANHKTPNTIRSARTLPKTSYYRKTHLDFNHLQRSLSISFIRKVRQMTFALVVGSITHGMSGVGRFGRDQDHKELSLLPIRVGPDEQMLSVGRAFVLKNKENIEQ